jgi:hypothetical protein
VSGEARAATATVDVDPGHVGHATVEGATVVHDRGGPALAVVAARTAGGQRVVATGPPELGRSPGEPVRVDGARLVG